MGMAIQEVQCAVEKHQRIESAILTMGQAIRGSSDLLDRIVGQSDSKDDAVKDCDVTLVHTLETAADRISNLAERLDGINRAISDALFG